MSVVVAEFSKGQVGAVQLYHPKFSGDGLVSTQLFLLGVLGNGSGYLYFLGFCLYLKPSSFNELLFLSD